MLGLFCGHNLQAVSLWFPDQAGPLGHAGVCSVILDASHLPCYRTAVAIQAGVELVSALVLSGATFVGCV